MGRQHIGKRLDPDIQVSDSTIIVTTRKLDLVFSISQVFLQVEIRLVCLQIRIGLGQSQQLTEIVTQPGFGRADLGYLGQGCLLATQAGNGLQGGRLIPGILADRLHQFGHEVVPTFQLYIDITPRGEHPITVGNQVVINDYGPDQQERKSDERDFSKHRLNIEDLWSQRQQDTGVLGIPRRSHLYLPELIDSCK